MRNMINYKLETYRGTLKQFMKVRHLRSINLYNYALASNDSNLLSTIKDMNIHSVKLDVMSGYIDLYRVGKNGRCGNKIDDATVDEYMFANNVVLNILENEKNFNFKTKRSILVGVYR